VTHYYPFKLNKSGNNISQVTLVESTKESQNDAAEVERSRGGGWRTIRKFFTMAKTKSKTGAGQKKGSWIGRSFGGGRKKDARSVGSEVLVDMFKGSSEHSSDK